MGLRDEILEQPAILRDLIDHAWPHAQDIARAIRDYDPDYVLLAARGTSDHAGLYAKYLWGALNGLPVGLATPSLFSLYHTPPRLRRALVVGISQSGQSPDIVSVVTEGRRQNALTLAITNEDDSPLAQAADLVMDIHAGEEKAVAATKTYTAQLACIALLSVALDENSERLQSLRAIPDLAERALALEPNVERTAERYRYMEQCVVIGRGFNYATAYEWALKLKELTYTVSVPYSSADFRHGPIAMVAQGFPVFAVTPQGAVYPDLIKLLRKLKEEHEVELLTLSDQPEALAMADSAFALPDGVPEWLSPLIAILPAQLFCYYLTLAKRLSTESPRGLLKVTKTK